MAAKGLGAMEGAKVIGARAGAVMAAAAARAGVLTVGAASALERPREGGAGGEARVGPAGGWLLLGLLLVLLLWSGGPVGEAGQGAPARHRVVDGAGRLLRWMALTAAGLSISAQRSAARG